MVLQEETNLAIRTAYLYYHSKLLATHWLTIWCSHSTKYHLRKTATGLGDSLQSTGVDYIRHSVTGKHTNLHRISLLGVVVEWATPTRIVQTTKTRTMQVDTLGDNDRIVGGAIAAQIFRLACRG